MGIDDYIVIVLGIVAICIVRFWLIKIYRRIRHIAKICEHFYKKDIQKGN